MDQLEEEVSACNQGRIAAIQSTLPAGFAFSNACLAPLTMVTGHTEHVEGICVLSLELVSTLG